MENILVISPHPDDETLGCGGTILKHISNKDHVFWLIVTDITDKQKWGEDRIKHRKKEIEMAAESYGFKEIFNLSIEPTTLDSYPFVKLVEKISIIIKQITPSVIYVNYYGDVHTDHQVVCKATISATKMFNNNFIKRILMYETLSETNFSLLDLHNPFVPNYYVDITEFLEKKIDIMKIYKTEIKPHPFPRSEESIKSLAILRGSEVNVKYAEGFVLLRGVW